MAASDDERGQAPQPGDRPTPEARRLDRPPADRYAPPSPSEAPGPGGTGTDEGSVTRAVVLSIPGAVIADAVYIAMAGPFAFSAGLVVVGIFAGRLIGLSARFGGGVRVPSDTRVVIALLVTLGWFVVAQLGTWLYAQGQGGVLNPLDFLLQAYGPVVPLVAMGAILAAWWSAR